MKLRDILHERNHHFSEALERSWQIAENWIPSLKMESESYAGKPHLYSVENWLDRLAHDCHSRWKHLGSPWGLNDMELYILLSAVLFHDIGRGVEGSGNHGKRSREILKKHWQQLGIFDARSAREIGLISEYHTQKDHTWRWAASTNIEPYGIVQTESLGALLTLADEFDTSYRRAIPDYMHSLDDYRNSSATTVTIAQMLKAEDDFNTKGSFREMVDCVDLDPEMRFISVVVNSSSLPEAGCEDSTPRGIADWEENCLNSKVCRKDFDIEEFFFSYLDSLLNVYPPHDQSKMNENAARRRMTAFLTRQFYLLQNDFQHLNSFRALTFPPRVINSVNLLDNTIYWRRCYQVTPREHFERYRHAIRQVTELRKFIDESLTMIFKRKGESSPTDLWKVELDRQELQNFLTKFYTELATFQRKKAKLKGLSSQECKHVDRLKNYLDELLIKEPLPFLDVWRGLLAVFASCDILSCIDYIIAMDPQENDKAVVVSKRFIRIEADADAYIKNLILAFHCGVCMLRFVEKRPLADFNPGPPSSDQEKVERFVKDFCATTSQISPEPEFNDPKHDAWVRASLEQNNQLLEAAIDDVVNIWKKIYYDETPVNREEVLFAKRFLFMQWLSKDVKRKNALLKALHKALDRLDIPFEEVRISYNDQLFDEKWHIALPPRRTFALMLNMFELIESSWLELATLQEDVRGDWGALATRLHITSRHEIVFLGSCLASLIYLINYAFDEDIIPGTIFILHFEDLMRAHCRKHQDFKLGAKHMQMLVGDSHWLLADYDPEQARKIKTVLEQLANAKDK